MNAAAKHNPQPEVIPLILPRSGHDRIQLGQKLQVVGMLLHLAFVRTQSFGEDELIAVACSFPAMSDIALMDGNCANDVVAFVDGCRDCQSFSSGVGKNLLSCSPYLLYMFLIFAGLAQSVGCCGGFEVFAMSSARTA